MSSFRIRTSKHSFFNNIDSRLDDKELGLRLIDSITADDIPIIKLLLEQTQLDVNFNNWLKLTPLHYAKSTTVVDLLVRYGANVNATEVDEYWTPLHSATSRGNTQIISCLLSHGADIEIDKDHSWRMYAIDKGFNVDELIANAINIKYDREEREKIASKTWKLTNDFISLTEREYGGIPQTKFTIYHKIYYLNTEFIMSRCASLQKLF